MPLQLISELVVAIVDLLRMSLIVAVPAFLLALAGQRLHKYLMERFKLSWIVSAFITTYAVLLPIVFVLYLVPFMIGLSASAIVSQTPPEFMQLTALDYAMAVIATIVKNLITTLLFAILLMPLLFFAAFASEKLKERFKVAEPIITFAAVFLTAFIAWLIVLFIFPWVIPGLVWKLYWSPI